jgi:hypothetical protein
MSLPPPPDRGQALPPPLAVPPLTSTPQLAPTRPYRSGRGLATVVRALLIAVIAVTGFDAAANLDAAQLIDRLRDDASAVSLSDLETSDSRTGVAALLQVAVMAAAFGFLVAWTSRMYRNLRSLGVENLRYTEGWAIGAWFIPLFNLVRPKQILNDIWRGSAPSEGYDWRARSVTPVLHWWWGCLILGVVLSFGSWRDASDLDEAHSAAVRAVVGDGVIVVAAVLEIVTITLLTDRQERKAGRAVTDRRSGWVPVALLSPLLGIAAFGAGLAAFSAADEEEPARSTDAGATTTVPAPEPTDAGGRTVLAGDLRVGDCILETLPGSEAEFADVVAVEVVECATPHREEVVVRVEHPAGEDAEFPGDEVLVAYAERVCADELEQSLAESYAASEFVLTYLWPLSESWDRGDRMIMCTVALSDEEQLVGTVLDAGA